MDMLCNKCSEPWDWFYIRDEVLIDPMSKKDWFPLISKEGGYFRDGSGMYASGYGQDKHSNWQFNPGPTIAQCPACIGKDIEPDDNAKIRAELAHLYGDDIDGFMADMEDFGLE